MDVLALGSVSGEPVCALPQLLGTSLADRRYTCVFTRDVSGDSVSEGDRVSNTVTVSGIDDDGTGVTGSDGAEVFVTSAPLGSLELIKTATPTALARVPGEVTYRVEITNTSALSPPLAITLDSLMDAVEGGAGIDITDAGSVERTTCTTGQVLQQGERYECEFVLSVDGGTGEGIRDVVSVSATDSFNRPLSARDEATVAILPPLLDIDVDKRANPLLAREGDSVEFSIVVANRSDVSLVLVALKDSVYGDINGSGTCQLPQLLSVNGDFRCAFSAPISAGFGPLHINTVTATAERPTRALLPGSSVSDSDSAFVVVLSRLAISPVPWGGGLALLMLIFGVIGLSISRK